MPKNYPIEKYKFIVIPEKRKIIAISSYQGKVVKATAICHPNDKFDLEKGKELAAARCNEKVAEKRLRRANQKRNEAADIYYRAMHKYANMVAYEDDAIKEKLEAREKVGELLGNF